MWLVHLPPDQQCQLRIDEVLTKKMCSRIEKSTRDACTSANTHTHTHFFELEIMSETYLQLHGQQVHEICFKHPNNYSACMGFEPTTSGLGNSCRQTQIVCTPTA